MLRTIFLLLFFSFGFIIEAQDIATTTQTSDTTLPSAQTTTTPTTTETTGGTTLLTDTTTQTTTTPTTTPTTTTPTTTPTTTTPTTTQTTTTPTTTPTTPTTTPTTTTPTTTPTTPTTTPTTTTPTTTPTTTTPTTTPTITTPTTTPTTTTTETTGGTTLPTTATTQTDSDTAGTTTQLTDTTTGSTQTTTEFELYKGPECQGDSKTCFKNAICDNTTNICICNEDFVLSGDWTECLPVAAAPYDSKCEEDSQCLVRMGDGANCTGGICVCGDGYHYLHSICYKTKGFGESCTEDDECFGTYNSESLSCKENQCNCSDGFYFVGAKECRRIGNEIGDECVFNEDCQFNGGYNCSEKDFICLSQQISETTTESTSTYSTEGESTTENYESTNTYSTEGESTTDGCESTNTYSTEGETTAVSDDMDTTSHDGETTSTPTKQIGDSCLNTDECKSSIENSLCFAGICECQPRFSNFSGNCYPDFGEACDKDPQYVNHGVCKDKRLRCKAPYIVAENNKECKRGRKYGMQCQENEDCQYAGGNALCVIRNCACFPGYHYVEEKGICVPTAEIGESCSDGDDCYVASGKVTCDTTCQCITGFHASEEKPSDCIPDVQELGDMCVTTKDCSDVIQHSVCFNSTCQCDTNYYQDTDNKICLTGIGGSCADDNDCTSVPNSFCQNETCICHDGTISNAENTACLEVPADITSGCEEAVQCNTAFGNCSDCINGTCQCNNTCHFQHKYCYENKYLGDSCFSKNECYLKSEETDRVQCQNGICKCGYQYTQTEDLDCKSDAYKNAISSVVVGTCVLIYIILCETKYTL